MFTKCKACNRLLVKGQTCTCGESSTGIFSEND